MRGRESFRLPRFKAFWEGDVPVEPRHTWTFSSSTAWQEPRPPAIRTGISQQIGRQPAMTDDPQGRKQHKSTQAAPRRTPVHTPPAQQIAATQTAVLHRVIGRRRPKRRPLPAWAATVERALVATWYFLRWKLPDFVKQRRREFTTALTSVLIHVLIALLMFLWLVPIDSRDAVFSIISGRVEDVVLEDPIEVVAIVQPEELKDQNLNSTVKQMIAELDNGTRRDLFESMDDRELRLPLEELADENNVSALQGEFGGRSEAGRRAAVKKFGGTVESESSVNLGLKWLQSIQRTDGSWSFGEVGDAGTPGRLTTTDVGATSLALLCMLGGGHTHAAPGPYQKTVADGVAWLEQSGVRSTSGADMRGRYQGNSGMYVQGLATICLCEASAMVPGDRELRRLALEATRFIEKSQGRDGGWRYQPREMRGDTSVVGWQVMALQSAKAGGISVKSDTFSDAKRFLNSVEAEDGVYYGYTRPEVRRATTTAVGLLCRMYLGWRHEKPQLKKGVEYLSTIGPSRDDIYFNYYATQVLYHWDGELWDKWNQQMREQLVATQTKDGPGTGSWDVTDPHGAGGGRLYQTALSILTLEVYYRHLPIYRRLDTREKSPKQAISAITP